MINFFYNLIPCLYTILRDLGNTHMVEVLEDARRARKKATSAAEDFEAAAGSPALDGAAALDKAGANPGEANRAADEREDLGLTLILDKIPNKGLSSLFLCTSVSVLIFNSFFKCRW